MIPYRRHCSPVSTPASDSFSAAMTCSSLNRLLPRLFLPGRVILNGEVTFPAKTRLSAYPAKCPFQCPVDVRWTLTELHAGDFGYIRTIENKWGQARETFAAENS